MFPSVVTRWRDTSLLSAVSVSRRDSVSKSFTKSQIPEGLFSTSLQIDFLGEYQIRIFVVLFVIFEYPDVSPDLCQMYCNAMQNIP